MKELDLDYENDVIINENNLDKEWIRQPQLISKYIQAKIEHDKVSKEYKELVKVVYAELRMQAVQEGEKLIGGKATDKNIDAWVITQKQYKKVVKASQTADSNAAMTSIAITALEHKKKALENLVVLFGMDYFSRVKDKSSEKQLKKELVRKRKQRTRERSNN